MGRRKRKYPEPVQATTPDGQVFEVNTAEQVFLQEIKDSEAKIVASIERGLTGKHEPSRVTNAAKVLDTLEHQEISDSLRERLEKLRPLVMDTLMEVSQKGKVASARAQANAIWLKAARGVGRLDWPPDERDPAFQERFDTCIDICNELRDPSV